MEEVEEEERGRSRERERRDEEEDGETREAWWRTRVVLTWKERESEK